MTFNNKKNYQEKEEKDFKPSEEIGGYKGLDPTRYGDWEIKGKVSDF